MPTDLSYLEYLIDCEGGVERGRLIDKEVLIYGPEKTGTVTLYFAVGAHLSNQSSEATFQHRLLHNHNQGLLTPVLDVQSQAFPKEALDSRRVIADLLEYRRQHGKKTLVVSSFREPVSRGISNVFQHVHNVYIRGGHEALPDSKECARLLRYRHLTPVRFQHPIEEIEPQFFETEVFDKQKKFLFVDRGHYQILVVCLEHSRLWPQILKETIGYSRDTLVNRNQASDKPFAAQYSEFKTFLTLPDSLINSVYHKEPFRKYLDWFYTRDEIDAFEQRTRRLYSASNKGLVFSDSRSHRTNVAIQVKALSMDSGASSAHLSATLSNIGETVWLPGRMPVGGVAVCLRSAQPDGSFQSSNWRPLQREVAPGERTQVDADFSMPPDAAAQRWHVAAVVKDIAWLRLTEDQEIPVSPGSLPTEAD